MDGYLPFALLIIGASAGALVSGFAGFAFSAVVGAFLLRRGGAADDGVQRHGPGHEPCDRAQQRVDQWAFRRAMLAIPFAGGVALVV
jgi:hypothetical protein